MKYLIDVDEGAEITANGKAIVARPYEDCKDIAVGDEVFLLKGKRGIVLDTDVDGERCEGIYYDDGLRLRIFSTYCRNVEKTGKHSKEAEIVMCEMVERNKIRTYRVGCNDYRERNADSPLWEGEERK